MNVDVTRQSPAEELSDQRCLKLSGKRSISTTCRSLFIACLRRGGSSHFRACSNIDTSPRYVLLCTVRWISPVRSGEGFGQDEVIRRNAVYILLGDVCPTPRQQFSVKAEEVAKKLMPHFCCRWNSACSSSPIKLFPMARSPFPIWMTTDNRLFLMLV